MGKPKTNYKRVVLNLPMKTAAILEYLVKIAQFARTKSDLIVQMVNDYLDKKRNILNDTESWRDFISRLDNLERNKVDSILKELTEGSVTQEEDEE